MLERARERLGGVPNASFAVEDGQALSFPDGSFDAVLCGLGLMFFPDPARGLAEFHRVLRPGGRAASPSSTACCGPAGARRSPPPRRPSAPTMGRSSSP
jgi:ubiquinone/menaquinone biosynthesis C-methylase UbiE